MTGTHAAPPAEGVAALAAPPVIVIVAMADEAEPFVSRASRVDEPVAVGGSLQRVVEIDGVELLLVQSGIGFVNAAGAATSAIVRAGSLEGVVPTVISAGTAAGMGVGIEIGDVVAGSEYVNLDADARVFGYRLGQVPGMPASFHADEALMEAAVAYDTSVSSVSPDTSTAGEASGDGVASSTSSASDGGWAVRPGLIASSDAFMTAERVIGVRSAFADVVDVDDRPDLSRPPRAVRLGARHQRPRRTGRPRRARREPRPDGGTVGGRHDAPRPGDRRGLIPGRAVR
jgi:adenosylhomocysteine nucleosidase